MDTKIESLKPQSRPRQRAGKPWSGADVGRLIVMAQRKVPADRIACRLQRSENAIRAEAIRQRVKLASTEKRSYGGLEFGAADSPRNRAAAGRRRGRSGEDVSNMTVSAPASSSSAIAGRGSRARPRNRSRGTETLF